MNSEGRKSTENEGSERLVVAFVVALLLHAAILPILPYLLPKGDATPISTEVETVKLSPEEWEQNLKVADNSADGAETAAGATPQEQPRATPAIPDEKQDEKKDEKKQGQVVYIGPSGDGKPPENARFLSEYNSKVDKETVSRYRRSDYANPLPTPSVTKEMASGSDSDVKLPGVAIETRPKDAKVAMKDTAKRPAQGDRAELKIPDLQAMPELNLPVDRKYGMFSNSKSSDEMRGNSDRFELKLGGREKQGEPETDPFGTMPPRIAALMPGAGHMGPIPGGPFNDHVEGVEEGEGTFLNAREYKYATFFNRVKRSVSQVWDPNNQLMKRDPSGSIYGQHDRLTVLKVVLDGQGNLKQANVEKGSGLDFLDDEAVIAFKRAQPFPNPPSGLMKDGEVSFAFGFYVEFSSARFRMFRYSE
ncbi:MAG: energy transducer TonB [Myxococcota bacterium]|jgi:TonB family protein